MKILRDVHHWLNQVLPSEQYRQTAEPGKKPSVQESLKGRQERIRQEQAGKQKPPRTQKQQDIPYEDGRNTRKQPIRPRLRRETEEQKFKRMERHCFRVLSDYYHLLRHWKEEYAPQQPDEAWNPRFSEALQNMSRLEYLMDVLLSGDIQERAALITGHGKEVRNLERRMAEFTAPDTAGNSEHGRQRRAAPER